MSDDANSRDAAAEVVAALWGPHHLHRDVHPVPISTEKAGRERRRQTSASSESSQSSSLTSASALATSPLDNWHRALVSALSPAMRVDPFAFLLDLALAPEPCLRHSYDPATGVWSTHPETAIVEPNPFARGSLRECFRAKKLSNWIGEGDWAKASNLVLKRYHSVSSDDAESNRSLVLADVKVQMAGKLLAHGYNRLHPPKQIDMLQTYILSFPSRPGNPHFCTERFIGGPYAKHNSNVGFVGGTPGYEEHVRLTPQAFSHWTFEGTFGRQMCVDIQGVDDLYTDPQLHTYPPVNPDSEDHVTGPDGDTASVSGGEGDLGIMGYALFFRTHRCNAVCKMLGLREFEHPPIPAGTPGIRHSEQSDYFDSTVPKDSAVGLGLSITPRKQRFESLYRRPSTNKAKKAADPDANPALKSPERLEVPFIPTLPRRKSAEFPHLKRRRSHPAKPEETDQLLSILALTHRTLARAFLVPGKLPVFNSDEYQPNPESAALFHYEAAAKLGDSAAAWYLSVAYDPERDDPEGELDELEQADGQRLPFIPKSQRSLEKVVEWTKCAADAGSVAACLRMADLSADSAEKLSWLEKALGFLGERRMLMSRDSTDFAFYHSRTLLSDLVAAESRFPHRSDLVPQAAEWAICAAMASLCEGETAAEWWERAAEECVEVGLGKKAEGFYMKAEEMRS